MPHLTITSFNDNWGGGFSAIHDHMRSLGFQADYQFKMANQLTQARLTYSVMNNRLATENANRTDELELYLRYPAWNPYKNLTVNVLAGGYLLGDIKGAQIQNFVHRFVGVKQVYLPYIISNRIFGFIGTSVWWIKPMLKIERETHLNLEFQGEYQWAPGYLSDGMGQMGISLSNQYSDKITLALGYKHRDVLFDKPLLNAVGSHETGISILYAMRLGVANFGMNIFPGNDFSSGYVGLSLLNWQGRKNLEQPNATAEFGSLTGANGFYNRYLWNELTEIDRFQLDLHYQFWTLTKDVFTAYPERHGHYYQLSAGGNYHFVQPNDNLQVLPYLSTRLGYKNERTYSGESAGRAYHVWSLNIICEGGLRLKLPSGILHNNCYYGLVINAQYVSTFYKSDDLQHVSDYPFGRSLGYLGLGGFVMIDIY